MVRWGPLGLVGLRRLLAAWLVVFAGVTFAPGASAATYEELMQAAKAARKAGDLEACVQALEAAHALRPFPEVYNNLGRIYEQMGRYARGYEIYQAVADDPTADRSLRALDSGRMATLQPKLKRAWLMLTLDAPSARAWVDGGPTAGILFLDRASGPAGQRWALRPS